MQQALFEARTQRREYASFDQAWRRYPHPKNKGSKTIARKKWDALPNQEQRAFFAAMPEYIEYVETHDWYSPCMMQTFLTQKRWEGLLEQLETERKQQERAKREPMYCGFTEAQLRREVEKARKGMPCDRTALRVARAHKIAPEAET